MERFKIGDWRLAIKRQRLPLTMDNYLPSHQRIHMLLIRCYQISLNGIMN